MLFWIINGKSEGIDNLKIYAYWERNPVALRREQLTQLAAALGVTAEDLLGENGSGKRGTVPTGKMRQRFEAASALSRSQQQKVLDILQPFIREHSSNKT